MIGLFDSGIGGLSLLFALRADFPNADYLYFADTANCPFGGRSRDAIRSLSEAAGRRFSDWGADLLQVACGTVSALALPELQRAFPHPVCGVIAPTVMEANAEGFRSILVLATEATVRSGVWERSLAEAIPGVLCRSLPCPLFVPLVESGVVQRNPPLLRLAVMDALAPLCGFFPDAILLGCTHFGWMAPTLADFFPGVPILDCALVAAKALRNRMESENGRGHGSLRLFVSDAPARFRQITARLYPLPEGVSVGQCE